MTISHLHSRSTAFVMESGNMSGEQFLADIARYQARISDIEQNKQALLFDPDIYQFAVKLFALSLAGFDVYLPQNGQPQTLKALQPNVGFCAGSTLTIDGLVNLDTRAGKHQLTADCVQWPESGRVFFSTSGSTGTPKLIEKHWHHLNCESDTLIRTFCLGQEEAVLSTVPHFHIYGLLFKLWCR